jgi:hypothetical protein
VICIAVEIVVEVQVEARVVLLAPVDGDRDGDRRHVAAIAVADVVTGRQDAFPAGFP